MNTKNNFTFSDEGHIYKLNGVRLTGVTSILGVIDKPALVGWSANMAIDYVEKNYMTKDANGLLVSKDTLKLARTAWSKNRDSAGDIGKIVHRHIENYVKSKMQNKPFPVIYENTQVKNMVEKFIEWSETENIKFLLSEQKIYSEKHWYAGTVDIVFEKDGKKYIGDIKTAKDIFSTNYLQMAGYHICFEELGKLNDLKGYCVINIPKNLNKKGEAKRKVKYVYNTDDCKESFLAALTLYRYINKAKPEWEKKLKNKNK